MLTNAHQGTPYELIQGICMLICTFVYNLIKLLGLENLRRYNLQLRPRQYRDFSEFQLRGETSKASTA